MIQDQLVSSGFDKIVLMTIGIHLQRSFMAMTNHAKENADNIFFMKIENPSATLLHGNDKPCQRKCGQHFLMTIGIKLQHSFIAMTDHGKEHVDFFCAVVITAECSAQKLRKEKVYKMYKLIPAELISAHIPHGSPLGMALREAIATQMALGYPR